MEEFKVSLKGDLSDLQGKIVEGRKQLNAFKMQSNIDGKIKLQADIAKFQKDLADARQRLREFRKQGNEDAEIKTRIEIQDLQNKINASKKVLRDFQGELGRTEKGFFSLNGIVKDAVKAFAGFEAVRKVFGIFKDAFDASVSFESAFAGVKKTVEATEDEFNKLSDAFRDLAKEIPISVESLAKIGESAGQLGVAKDKIIDFTRTVAKIAVTTNLTEDAAATSFARIANVLQAPIDSVDQMASAVVDLGNNFATTESEILAFANRISSTGAVVGLTSADLFAIGTAFSSVGIEAESGGTAVQKALLEINNAVNEGGESLKSFAGVAGITAKDFTALWKSNPAKAFDLFIKGLGKSGADASKILEDLVSGDVRLERAFLALANSGGILTKALETSNKAFSENTALNAEAEKRFQTAESKLQAYKNTWNDIGIVVGNFIKSAVVPVLGFLTQLGEDLVLGTNHLGTFTSALKAAGVTITTYFSVTALAAIVKGFKNLITTLATLEVALPRVTTGLAVMKVTGDATALSVSGIGKAMTLLSRVPIVALVAGFATVAFSFFNAKQKAMELDKAVANLSETLTNIGGQQSFSSIALADELEVMAEKLKEQQRLVNDLYFKTYSGVQGSMDNYKNALTDQTKSIEATRAAFIEYLESLGATESEIENITSEMSLFGGGIVDLQSDLDALGDKTTKIGKTFAPVAAEFSKLSKSFQVNVDTLVKENVDLADAVNKTVDSMQDDFKRAGKAGENMAKNLKLEMVRSAAQSGELGKAFTIGYKLGLESPDVLAQVAAAGVKINETTIGVLLGNALEAKDAGKINAIFHAIGIKSQIPENEKNAQTLANAVTKTLNDNAGAAFSAGEGVGQSSVSGILQGIKDKFPQFAKAIDGIFGALKVVNPITKAFGIDILKDFDVKKVKQGIEQVQQAINAPFKSPPIGGGKKEDPAKEAAKEAEDALKKAEKAAADFNDEIQKTEEAASKLRDKIKDFYGDIVNEIDKAVEAQANLANELNKFKGEATVDFVTESAGRAFQLDEDRKDTLEQIAKLQKDEQPDLERIAELQKELKDIEAERAKINEFIGSIKANPIVDAEGNVIDLAKVFDEAFKEAGLSDFEQAKIAFDKKIELKEKEIQAEIEKQKQIEAVQRRFLELQTSNDETSINARKRLNAIANGEEVLNAEQRKQALQELGFGELSVQDQINLLKQAQQADALEKEKEAILAKEEEIKEAKIQFFKDAQAAHKSITDEMLVDYQRLLDIIKAAQFEVIKLNALRAAGAGGGGSTTNLNITNNNNSNVDAEAANNNLINKLNQ